MSKKEIKPLSEAFLKSFDSKASRVEKQVVSEATEVQILESKLSDVTRQINAARIGGVGNIGKLSEEKARLQLALQEAYGKKAKKEALDPVGKADADIDNDGDVDSSDEYLHKRRKAIKKAIANEEVEVLDESKALLKDYQAMKAQGKKDHNIMDVLMSMPKYKKMTRDQMAKVIGDAKRKGIFKEDLDLNEAKLDASDFEAEDPPKGIDFDNKNLRKVNWKLYDDKTIREIIKRADNNADEPSIHGGGHNQLRGYYQQIIKAAKAELKKRGIKEDVEVTELHMALLEAHGIEKKVAERVKKVFDAMSDADKAAFMKAYLKNPKAATEHMFGSMKKMVKEDEEKMVCKDCGDEFGKPKSDCENDCNDPDGKHWVKESMYEEVASSEGKKSEQLDELSPKTMDSYSKKAKMKSDRARNSATAKLVRGNDDISKEKDTIRKREKGMKMADRGQARAFRKAMGYDKKKVNEEVELDEDVRKMSNSRLKFHMNNKNVPHGSYSWYEMKAERDRRLKTGGAEAYKKAKMSMSEEVELDEARWEYKGDKTYMVGGNLSYDDKMEYKLSKANADILNKYMKQAKSDAERGKVWKMFWDSKESGNRAKGPEMAIAYAKKAIKEEVELDEGYTINHKTFSSAVQHAKAQVEKQGYTIDDDEWDRKVAMGPRKPGTGKTNRYTIDLMKGGKETRRKLQMQVYYDEGRYELNMYVS